LTLRQFVRYAQSVGHNGPITSELAVSWARSSAGHTEAHAAKKYELARRATEHSAIFDETVPRLQAGILGKPYKRVAPYIYSDDEVSLLMKAASGFRRERDPLKPLAYEVVIGIMRSAGLRTFEALALEDADFDKERKLLFIKTAKNNKERLVPLDESTCRAIVSYQVKRDELRSGHSCKNLVVCDGDRPFSGHNLQYAFKEIRSALLGQGEVWERRPPRLFDLRHTYAVQTLLGWHRANNDVNPLLPVLATYMGHAKITATYWYLTGTPDLLEIACSAFEGLAKAGDGLWQPA
jgi:integrase